MAVGPEALLDLKKTYLVPCVYHFYRDPPEIVAAEGVYLIDHTGRRYLDCYSGVTVMNAGHCNPAIIEPAIEQIRTLQHTTTIYLTEPILRLAEKLADLAPGDLKRSFFCASGSEATEGALLLAALHTGRPEVVAMSNGLHGRTRWVDNATGLPMWRSDPFPLRDVHHVGFNDLVDLERVLDERAGQVSAVIAEPIQGNGGINVPASEYWPAVRRLCHARGILLILDEVQTGFNRTGRWFACGHWNVVPDIMAVSKALGNGFPIAALVTTDSIAASYDRPGASTFGGNPVAATAALATLRFHESAGLGQRAATNGAYMLSRLTALAGQGKVLANPRGKGLMLGVDIVDGDGKPDTDRMDLLLEDLKDRGFLCGKTGADRNVLTFMPPLTIERQVIDALLDALSSSLQYSKA